MNNYNNLSRQATYPYGYQGNAVSAQEMQYQTQAYTPMPQAYYLKGRPVVSIDEARASQIDLDGSLYIFPDLGNKRIYTKQINMDGTATFNVYELAPQAAVAPQNSDISNYVTKEELDEKLANLKASLTAKTKLDL